MFSFLGGTFCFPASSNTQEKSCGQVGPDGELLGLPDEGRRLGRCGGTARSGCAGANGWAGRRAEAEDFGGLVRRATPDRRGRFYFFFCLFLVHIEEDEDKKRYEVV